jgi:hypothetical protein
MKNVWEMKKNVLAVFLQLSNGWLRKYEIESESMQSNKL